MTAVDGNGCPEDLLAAPTDPLHLVLIPSPYLSRLCSYKLVNMLYQVVPDILTQTGKVKNPW